MAIIFITIQLINRLHWFNQLIIYGGRVSSPTMNVLAIFFGVRQAFHSYSLPHGISTRIMFILFMFYCLIIRTCYQKLSFEFLQTDIRVSPYIYDFDDLIWNNYTFLVTKSQMNVFGQFNQPNIKILEHQSQIFDILSFECFNTSAKLAILTNSFANIEGITGCEMKQLPGFSEINSVAIRFPPNNVLSDLANDVVDHMIDSGIVKKSIDTRKEMRFGKMKYLRVFSLADLSHYFIIWITFVAFSCVAFIIEMIYGRFRKRDVECIYLTHEEFENLDKLEKIQECEEEVEVEQSIDPMENEPDRILADYKILFHDHENQRRQNEKDS